MVPTFRRLDFRHEEKQESSHIFLGDTAGGLIRNPRQPPGMYRNLVHSGLNYHINWCSPDFKNHQPDLELFSSCAT